MTYNETIDYLVKNTKLKSVYVFNYQTNSGNEYFENAFQFYSKNLAHNKNFGANPSYVLFYNKKNVYAIAKKSMDHYMVIFDRKLISKLGNWYKSYFDFGKIKGLESYAVLEEKINFIISILLEQAILHFTFYHEFAHLIQFSGGQEIEREENIIGNCDFNQDRHIEEYDADIFSAICIATHIYEFIESKLGKKLDENLLNDFIAITIAGVMVYVLSLPMCKEEFYTKEGSHPHNSIRVNYINMAIVNHFKDILSQRGSEIKIDDSYINGKSFMILNSLLSHFGLDDLKLRFSEDMGNKWEEISNYQQELHNLFLNYELSAVTKWNEK